METIIKTKNISKYYETTKAVQNLFLTVNKGEIYGFLGVNGAGKTTTIRLLLGMIKATKGTAYINENPVNKIKGKDWNQVGYLVEDTYSYPELTVEENLEVIYHLRNLTDKNVIDQMINKLKLARYRNVKFKNLSSGNKQRLGLAKALIHNPEILILDEPTKGLDPAGIVEIRKLLKELSQKYNTTIFISSHILSEVSKLVDRIGIIHEGKLIQEIDHEDLEKLKDKYLFIDTVDNKKAQSIISEMGYEVFENNDYTLRINNKKALSCPEKITVELVNKGVPPKTIKIEQEDLESYFLKLTDNNEPGEIQNETT
jgi:ABC-2 type transport system ATP-binding protein